MNFNDKVVTTLIAGGVSSVGFVLTYFAAKRKSQQVLKLSDRELSNKYVEKLYELRIKHYGRAFEITDLLGKQFENSKTEVLLHHESCLQSLRDWKKGEVNLVISEEALMAYYKILKALQELPDSGGEFSKKQLESIWECRNLFRKSLRQDLGLLHSQKGMEF